VFQVLADLRLFTAQILPALLYQTALKALALTLLMVPNGLQNSRRKIRW
jgi:hypothetical protein